MIHDKKNETLARSDLEQLQLERLQGTLNRVERNVEFYKKKLNGCKICVDGLRSMRDLLALPFTERSDLEAGYPYAMFAVPLKDIVRIHSAPGGRGRAVVLGYTQNDLRHWSGMAARALAAAGVTEHDFVQVAFLYSLFTGGLGFHYGAETLGASVVPSSEGSDLLRQLKVMQDYKITALVSTPNYALKIAHAVREMKIPPGSLHLKCGLFGAEPWSERERREIEETLGIRAYDNYGPSEVMGPGVAFECEQKKGLHVNEDHFIVEVIDPGTLEPLPEGAQGELVFTTLTKEGFPLIRYRTGDLASLETAACPCGRTTARISRIAGRVDDLITVKGVSFFPEFVGEILKGVKNISPRFQIVIDKKHGAESVEIRVEISENLPFFDEIRTLEGLKQQITRSLRHALDLTPRVTLVEPNSLAGKEGKAVPKVIDNRQA